MAEALRIHPKVFGVWFKDLYRWDPSSFQQIIWQWPNDVMRPIGSFLRPRKEKVDRSRYPFSDLQPITIHFDGSIDRREVDCRREYTMELFFAKPGDIVVAKIDLKNGAVGIVPNWENVVVTGHFAVYEPDRKKVVPEYFHRVIQDSFFKEHLWRNKVGAEGRKEVKLDFFEGQQIPLPSLYVQQIIVDRWQAAQNEVTNIKRAIVQKQVNLEMSLLREIGINLLPAMPRKGAFVLNWLELERWDTFFYREDFVDLQKQLILLGARPLGELVCFISRPWTKTDFPEGTFRYIEISGVFKDAGIIDSREVEVMKSPSRATTLVKTGDFILSTTRPYLGAFAIVPETYNNCVCSSAFAVADSVDEALIDKDFLLLFLKSPAGLRQMERCMTGGLYPAIVQAELEKILIPLPSLSIQKNFVRKGARVREEGWKLRESAANHEAEVALETEEMILGIRPVK